MMKQLRWLCYLKSLKLLLFTLLIGFFGFWVNSFVSAVSDGCVSNDDIYLGWWFHPVGWTFTSSFSNSFDIWVLNYWTVFTQSLWFGKKVFAPVESALFWWGIDWLPYIYFNGAFQWVPNSYFICDSISDWNNRVWNCSKNELTSDSLSVIISFLSSVNSSDSWGYYYEESTYYRNFNICISSVNFWKSLCFKFYTCDYNSSCHSRNCLLHDSNNYTNLTFASIPDSIIGESPAVSSWWWDSWDSNIVLVNSWSFYTNSQIYNWLLDMWYFQDLCYWDYISWSLINSSLWINQFFDWWDCVDWQTYCWMDLVELYNLTTSTSNITRTFDSWFSNNYNLFKLSFSKDDLINWNWKFKALWKIMFKVYNNDFNINFRWNDFLTFCQMTKDIENWSFDWNWIFNNSWYVLNDNTLSYINNVFSDKYSSWQYVLSGAEISWFSDMFDLFSWLYYKSVWIFHFDSDDSWSSWILPLYIVFGFMMFFLLYILKR